MPSTISADFATANTDAGPYWAMNSTWNEGGLVNGKDFTQSVTMENPNSPNINTTISWNWPNTPASFNVYSYPAVFYGGYAGFNAPATNVTPEQINNIKTLTLSQNVSLSGQTDQYDSIYDGYTTSTPNGGSSSIQHEVEVYVHSPSYVQDWIKNLPQHNFTDNQGLHWTIATSGNIVVFAPSDFRDLTNYTTDLKGLLSAAQSDGLISGSEYFNGIALGNEPREGSGSMTIHSFTVNYDGDTHSASGGGTPTANPPAAATSPPAADPPAASSPPAAGDPTHASNAPAAGDPAHAGNPPAAGAPPAAPDPTHASNAPSDTNTPPATDPTPVTGSPAGTGTGSGPHMSSNTHHHHHGMTAGGAASGDGGGVAAAGGTGGGSGHGASCGTAANDSQHDHSNGGGNNLVHHMANLLQALQQNNTNVVNNAVTAPDNHMHAASAADPGSAPNFTHNHFEHFTHQFEHMWG